MLAVVAVTLADEARCSMRRMSSLVAHARSRREALGSRDEMAESSKRLCMAERIDDLRGGGRRAAEKDILLLFWRWVVTFASPMHTTGNMKIALCAWESLHSVAVGGVAPHVTELAAGLCRRGTTLI